MHEPTLYPNFSNFPAAAVFNPPRPEFRTSNSPHFPLQSGKVADCGARPAGHGRKHERQNICSAKATYLPLDLIEAHSGRIS